MAFFFQRKNKLQPVDFIFSSNSTTQASMEIATGVLTKIQETYKVDASNTYTDLEIFSSVSEETSSLMKSLDQTYTFMGRSKLKRVLENPSYDIKTLRMKQRLVKTLKSSSRYTEVLEYLEKLREHEKSVLWLLREKTREEQHIIDSLYFKNRFLKNLNNNESVMNIYNFFRIIFSPVYGLLSPLMFMLVPFIYLRLFTGIRIPFSTYLKLFRLTLFGGIPDPIDMIRTTQNAYNSRNPEMIRNLLGNARARTGGIKVSKLASMLFSLVLYIQNVINSFEISGRTRETVDSIHVRLSGCAKYIATATKLIEITDNILENKETNIENPFPILSNPVFKEEPSLMSNKGSILVSFKEVEENSKKFNNILEKVGEIDNIVNTIKLLNSNEANVNNGSQYSFAEYVVDNTPKLIAKEIWHPCLDREKVVLNSVNLGNPNPNMVITGPNAGGKSTFIKSITINVLLSQTLGITAASEFRITPFSLINTYLNIPDVKGKESLFEAEMHRAREHLLKLEDLPKNQYSFLIMDEIFSSTNPEEGISGGYAICEMLGKYANSISIITTHFTKLTDLEKTSNFSCYKIPINRDNNGDIEYTYKLEPGVSDQFIALELLGKKGFDKDIVNRAINLCQDIRKKPVEEPPIEEPPVEEPPIEEPVEEPVEEPEPIPEKPKRTRKPKKSKPVKIETDETEP